MVKKQIFWFEIPVNYIELMHVLNARNNLLVKLASFLLFKFCVLHYVIEKLPSTRVFHDEVELLGGLDDLIELNDVGVTNHFQDVDLPRHPLNV